jgi:hypothetical protein
MPDMMGIPPNAGLPSNAALPPQYTAEQLALQYSQHWLVVREAWKEALNLQKQLNACGETSDAHVQAGPSACWSGR